MKNSLPAVIDYLIENGMDESEVNHFLHEKNYNGKSLMNLIAEKEWESVWINVNRFIFGDIWINN